ncbi:MAG: hypothetical protein H8D84_00585 [Proteobacteria bacterium]|nr:hypothetical protein [Pseudomonadota bacterium]
MSRLKVQGYGSLVREVSTNAIINTDKSEYELYMSRTRIREEQGDKIRVICKEINTLKADLREIKDLLKKDKE